MLDFFFFFQIVAEKSLLQNGQGECQLKLKSSNSLMVFKEVFYRQVRGEDCRM